MVSINETRRLLESVESIDSIVANKLIEIQQWYDLAASITASMDGERVMSSGTKQKMADAVNKCLDAVDEILYHIDQLKAKKKMVTQTIEQLYNPTEYKVLHMRYIQYKTLNEIDNHFGKDEWAKVVCQRAIGHVQAILNKQKCNHA